MIAGRIHKEKKNAIRGLYNRAHRNTYVLKKLQKPTNQEK